MITKEERVLEYIKIHNNDPLYFKESCSSRFNFTKDSSVEDLILCCLDISRESPSYRKMSDGSLLIETPAGRYRSSIDIWRHIISIRPEVTIFEVMNSIYNIKDKLYGQYCITVWRRVFKNIRSFDTYTYLDNQGNTDEYSLTLYNWKDIGKNE